MSSAGAKEIMYIYNGNEKTAEVEFDADGTFPVPPDGSILQRNGRQWKVARVSVVPEAAGPTMSPVLRINLTDQY
jgi:hypothetical protein